MTLRLSLEEAGVEVALLKVRMYRSGCTCRADILQELSDHLYLLLKFMEYRIKT